MGQFYAKSDDGIFLGYSTNSRAFRVFNLRTSTIMESANVVVDDSCSLEASPSHNEDFSVLDVNNSGEIASPNEKPPPTLVEEDNVHNQEQVEAQPKNVSEHPKESSARVKKNHPLDKIIESLESKGLEIIRVW